ncbi:MAG: acyltransferase [Bacteroidetes bacterium HGW-Bacteroidetes-21]|jgi:acetyltransferase-like isoleucine patch superfamily enzyme|nr:MAG: acyltransferase [Bacteroidetes bacterium HGW-Bacteroidetes-21]
MRPIKNYFKFGYRYIWWIIFRTRFKKLGKNSFIYNPILITPSYIYCGKNVKVFKSCRIQGITKYNNTYFSPTIRLEDNVSIQQNLHLTCANSIVIGENTAIASNVTITDIHHPYENINIPIEKQDIEVKDVTIGKNCKIYNNAVILPGVHIGNHVTIGANSVVTRDVPDFCVATGAPAKIFKKYNIETKQWGKTNPDGSFITI